MIDNITIAGVSGQSVTMGGAYDYPVTYYDDPCDFRFEESDRVRQHGIWPDFTWMGKRSPELHFDLLAPDSVVYNQRRLALMGALLPQPERGFTYVCELNIVFTGYEAMHIRADVDSISIPRDGGLGPAIGNGQLLFRCPYPFYKSSVVYTANTGAPLSGGGGRTYPKTYPFSYAAGASTGGNVTIRPVGNVITYPTIRVYGPTTYPTIARNDAGTLTPITVNIVLTAGQWIDIDMDGRTIKTQDGIDVSNKRDPSSKWWGLLPNVDNNIIYRPYDSSTGTDVMLSWYNQYHF